MIDPASAQRIQHAHERARELETEVSALLDRAEALEEDILKLGDEGAIELDELDTDRLTRIRTALGSAAMLFGLLHRGLARSGEPTVPREPAAAFSRPDDDVLARSDLVVARNYLGTLAAQLDARLGPKARRRYLEPLLAAIGILSKAIRPRRSDEDISH